ncbi:small multidrug resistance pump [Acidovorax sp. 62]|nr:MULTISPECIES: SMR family transporter [unclassified Acidovorax]AYM95393.1 QacE family quaternary ammonium compound efflux SMR transporter [Acidovorax sp. 1608163]PIF91791.1 small multidrug resistance pump [Acidovorax sp. 62]
MPLPAYALLGAAILAEVIGTSALKASEGFTRPLPSALTAVAYVAAFYALSLTLKTVPLGIAYGVWSGVGIVLVSAVGWVVYDQRLDTAALLGIGLILAGVLVIHLFSRSTGH